MSAIPEAHDVAAPMIPGCRILRPLNEGGMGKVYLARQDILNRLVCVKVLAIPAGEDAQVWRLRFHREAELLARVSDQHILQIFGFGVTDGSGLPYLVSEYVEGGDLRRCMTSGQPLPTDQARAILRQVGDALTYLHDRGILHRDLKPENVLMTDSGLVKVGDLGLAVEQDQAGVLTRSDRGMGTVGYISPEQQYALGVDERADQFSLAAMSYELLTGRRPLGVFPPPSRANRRLSREVDAVILRGLAEEPKDRYPGVQDYLAALDRSLSSRDWRARKLILSLAATSIVLGSAAGLAWSLKVGSPKNDGTTPVVVRPGSSGRAEAKSRPDPGQGPQFAAKEASETKPRPIERSPEFTRLVELRAYSIWDRGGRPTGEAAKQKNWLEAKLQICDEVDARAYQIWEEQGRPTGEAGEAVRESNQRAAEAELLKEAVAESRLQRSP